MSQNVFNKGIVIACLDARRMEVYSAVFNNKNDRIRDTKAEILTEDSFNKYLSVDEVYFIGKKKKKIKEIITHKNARFVDDMLPSSRQMGVLSFKKFNDNQFEDLNNFEPFYLKDFIGTKWNATQ